MEDAITINNVNYRIQRFYNEGKTVADIIEEKFTAQKAVLESLTIDGNVDYNVNGGSISIKEVKQ